MAQAFGGKFQAWAKEAKPTKGQRIRPSKNVTKTSPLAVNPAFRSSSLEDSFQPVLMKTPGKPLNSKSETSTNKFSHWSGKTRTVPAALPWAVSAIACVLSVLALLLTLLMFFGEMENPNCRCTGLKGASQSRATQGADSKEISDKMELLEEKVTVLERMLGMHRNDITNQEYNLTAVRQKAQESRERVAVLAKMLNESKEHEAAVILGLQATLNLTRHEVTSLNKVWHSVNGTQSDVNSVWRALNRTDGQLVRLSRGVWTEVNSTKDDLQRLRNATHNITDQMESRLADVWGSIRTNQRCCSNLTSSLDSVRDELNATAKQLELSDQNLLGQLSSMNTSLYTEVNAISKMPGPVGPPGHNGSRGLNGSQGPAGPSGPKGAGDFSQCVHKVKGGTSAASGAVTRTDVFVNQLSDKRIVGATCSTDDAAEYRLSSQIIPSGEQQYKCECAGRSSNMKSSDNLMKCFIHYWECPH